MSTRVTNTTSTFFPNPSRSLLFTAILSATLSTNTFAQSNGEIEEIVVVSTASRNPERSVQDIPIPVDNLSSDALRKTGQTETGRMIQSLAPSFNFSSSSISDGTDALRPATLRGLGPDQTLVFVNGKRRHQAALIHINTSVGRGTAGTDMNAIPGAALSNVEIVRDGAASQYGSDAIAGVINLKLNNSSEGGFVNVSRGEYSEGDGETINVDLNKGFTLGDTGFLNATLNYRDRDFTNRAGLHGSCQFPGCFDINGDPIDTDNDGFIEPTDPREITAPRNTFRIGDAISEQKAFILNGGFELGEGEVYGFMTYSKRDNQSAAFFRHNGNTGGNAPLADGDATIPDGFLPYINSIIRDTSTSIGYKIEMGVGETLDISYTNGVNVIDYTTSNSLNSSFANAQTFTTTLTPAEIRSSVPREAYAYGLELGLNTINIDYTKNYGSLFLAFGAELREDEYKILAGEEYSYRDYDTVDGMSLYTEDRSGGIQGFPGIGPQSEVDETRNVISFYAEAEYEFERALVNASARYDDYEGFGDTINVKVAGKFDINDQFSVRGGVGTGFRAPSMQQLYFNNTSTQFLEDANDIDNDGDTTEIIAQEVGTFRNDSSLARGLGIPQLKEEESTNLSLGVIANITDQFSLTVDLYSIDIDDRIVISNQLGFGLSNELDTALIATGAGAAQFFLNGADTETDGFDIVAAYSDIEMLNGYLDVSLSANFTETEVTRLFTPVDSPLGTVSIADVFSAQDISIIEEWQPKDRISLSGAWSTDMWAVNLAFNRYGEYTVLDGGTQTYGAKVLTDLKVSYMMDNGLSFSFIGNNIFDVYPDENTIGNSRTGAIEDGPNGPVIVNSPGVFTYSRRSAPFGFNGAYYAVEASYSF